MIDATTFVGMSKHRAHDYCEAKSIIFRLCKVNGEEYLPFPKEEDKREDRICVEIENGTIVKAVVS